MRLLIKQKVFSLTESFNVYDENENVKYTVKGEFFSLGKKLHVYDASGNELGMIRQKLLTFFPMFMIDIGGREVGTISKGFSFFRDNYTALCLLPRDNYQVDYKGWDVRGDWFDWDYEVYRGDYKVLDIQTKLLSWGDTYIVDVKSNEDELAALMLVLAIDAVNDAKRAANSSSYSS